MFDDLKYRVNQIKWSDKALSDLERYAAEEGKTLEQLKDEIEGQFCKDMQIKKETDPQLLQGQKREKEGGED